MHSSLSTGGHSFKVYYPADANKPACAQTIEKLIHHCFKPRYIITGHSPLTGGSSLKHTIKNGQKTKAQKRGKRRISHR